MKKDFKILTEKIKSQNNQKQLWKKITAALSCLVFIATITLLIMPGLTLGTETETYTLTLKDSYNFEWKENFNTTYTLELIFLDTNGNYIEGKDVTIELSEENLKDDPYGFGYIPINGETTRGLDALEILNLKEYTLPTGEKYKFDHAEVYINDTWQQFMETSNHWDIWCQYASSADTQTDYGWRGKYGENVAYTVTEKTKYKLVYELVRSGQDKSVESLDATSGISFKMFNYHGNNNQTGINNNGLYDYFSFRDSSLEITTHINQNTDADGFVENRAKVLPNLENGYPIFDCRGYCTNTSLGYLFGAQTNALGNKPEGVIEYNPINTLLQKETINNVEYYYYDSNRNAVDYDIENNRFMLRDYVERGYTLATYKEEILRYEFLPFNYFTKEQTKIDANNFTYNYEKEELDHWFGMTMEFSFYMPKDGTINGTDMIFEFSGDDDVWVFIDDVLVLDLGGTHGAVDGTINFKTGEVTSFLNWNGTKGTPNTTTIYESFSKANQIENTKWNTSNTTFKDYTLHTVKFFYLERGAAISNCTIKFNIPVLPSGSVSVRKQYDGIDKYNDDYKFTIYDTTNEVKVPVINTKYKIGDRELTTDENGNFTLKSNEVAIFKLTNYHKYYITETDAGIHSISSNCTLDGNSCFSVNQTQEFTINPDSAYQAIFTNKIKTFDLIINKKVDYENSDETFDFKIELKDENGLPIIPNLITTSNTYQLDETTGIITYHLKNNETITLSGIPINTNINLQETKHDGYQTVIKTGDITLSNTDTYQFTITQNTDITVHNIPGVSLPETGGSGLYRHFIIGFCLIFTSLGFIKFLNLKEGG